MIALGTIIIVGVACLMTWACLTACESCAYTRAGVSGDPILESIGLARATAARIGVRLGQAPNQGVRHARYRALARTGLGADSLRWADARMSGAVQWIDTSGARHYFPARERVANQYMTTSVRAG